MNKQSYSTNDLANLLGVAQQSIRRWSIEFAQYLSPLAATENSGKTRVFTEDDGEVLTLVADLKASRLTFDDIHIALARGDRKPIPQSPPTQIELADEKTLAIKLRQAEEREKALLEELEIYKEQLKKLPLIQYQLESAKEDNIKLGTVVTKLETVIESLRDEIRQLNKGISESYHSGLKDGIDLMKNSKS